MDWIAVAAELDQGNGAKAKKHFLHIYDDASTSASGSEWTRAEVHAVMAVLKHFTEDPEGSITLA